jgi:hypothetical protein
MAKNGISGDKRERLGEKFSFFSVQKLDPALILYPFKCVFLHRGDFSLLSSSI